MREKSQAFDSGGRSDKAIGRVAVEIRRKFGATAGYIRTDFSEVNTSELNSAHEPGS